MLESGGLPRRERSTTSTRPERRPGGPTAGCFGSRHINKPVLKIFDKTVWLWRRLDVLMPWPGLSLIVVARKRAGAALPRRCPRAPRNACRKCPLRMPTELGRRPLPGADGRVRRQAHPGDRRPDARRVHLGQGVAHLARSARPGGERHGRIVLSRRGRQRGAQCAGVYRGRRGDGAGGRRTRRAGGCWSCSKLPASTPPACSGTRPGPPP